MFVYHDCLEKKKQLLFFYLKKDKKFSSPVRTFGRMTTRNHFTRNKFIFFKLFLWFYKLSVITLLMDKYDVTSRYIRMQQDKARGKYQQDTTRGRDFWHQNDGQVLRKEQDNVR